MDNFWAGHQSIKMDNRLRKQDGGGSNDKH